ncbi:MAG: phosphatidylcholine/phosphatidylserine synthase [Pseudomonadota bacterium]
MDDLESTHVAGPQPIAKMIPNLVTMMALIAGIYSLQKAINGDFEGAVLMLLAAALFDVLDGAIARALKAQSEFGAQLDSLSDFLAFGIAPAIILYEWTLSDAGKLCWIASVVFPVAAALRLARFNVIAKQPDDIPQWKKRYFMGVPTPAGAALCLLPIYIWFLSPSSFESLAFATPLVAVWVIIIAALMVSRIPTFSIKYVKLPPRMMVPMLGFFALIVAALIHAPWITLSMLSIAYVVSIPMGLRHYRKQEIQYRDVPEDLTSLAFGIETPITNECEED